MIAATMEKIPGYLGHLVINEDGAVIASGGDLENDENSANVIFSMIHAANKVDLTPTEPNTAFKRISVHYDSHVYLVAMSNRKIHVLKKRHIPHDPVHV